MQKAHCVVLFVDIVESVRLVNQDEEGTISRWLSIVAAVREMLDDCGGRIIKQLGDGLLLAFASVRSAVNAAFLIIDVVDQYNVAIPPSQHFRLRLGIESSEVLIDNDDIFGRGVNAAARLMSLAGPNEIVLSASAREEITDSLDADVEDLGECYLRHFDKPIHAFRITPPGSVPAVVAALTRGDLRPTLAVVPFDFSGAQDGATLGNILTDDVVYSLSRSPDLNVISRQSAQAFAGRAIEIDKIAAHLKVDYVLTGVCRANGDVVSVEAEFIEARSAIVVWSERLRDAVHAVASGESDVAAQIVAAIGRAITLQELQRARVQPLATLRNYTLLFSAIALMHRLTARDFADARTMLQLILDRGHHQPVAHAWIAKWHVLRVAQGWSDDLATDGRLALEHTGQAIDSDPEMSMAYAMAGFVEVHLFRRFDAGRSCYEQAIALNPNDSMALLLRGMLEGFTDGGPGAARDTEAALVLTPLHPLRYFYESLAASANVTAGHYGRAADLATRSLRRRRTHASTWRALAVAQWQLGQEAEARASVQELLKLEPALTVSSWLRRAPSADYRIGRLIAGVLGEAGVPA